MVYPAMADGPEEHLGLDIVQDLGCLNCYMMDFCAVPKNIFNLHCSLHPCSPPLLCQMQDSSDAFDPPRWVPQLHAAAKMRTLLCADDEAHCCKAIIVNTNMPLFQEFCYPVVYL